MTQPQAIYYYIVKVVYLKPGRGKQKPTPFRQSGVEIVSRAKTLSHLNRDKKAIEFAESQVRGASRILSLRIYEIIEQKQIGVSSVYLEDNYAHEYGWEGNDVRLH